MIERRCRICRGWFIAELEETDTCEDCYFAMEDDFDADELGLDPEEPYDA